MSKLKVAVVGLGIGEQHALAFHEDERCELKSLFDFSKEKANAVQKRVGAGEVVTSFEEILSDPEIDIVSLASYDHLHYEQVLKVLKAGKHVFVEKPLCRTISELRDIYHIWRQTGNKHLCSNLVLREAPVYKWLKHAIDEGRLGEIYAIDTDYLYGRLHKITEGWRKTVPDYSVMEGGGIHMLDLVLSLSSQRPQKVTSIGNRICTKGSMFAYQDFMSAMFEYESSLIVRVTANFGCVHRHQHILRVFGTKGTFILDDMGPRLHESREENEKALMLDLEMLPSGKGVLIPQFIDNILNGTGLEEAAMREFELVSVIAASDASIKKQKTVRVEYIHDKV